MASNPFDTAAVKAPSLASLGGLVSYLMDHVQERLERRRQLRQLDAFDDRMLADIGLSRCDVESAKHSSFGR
ncbi:DUF1127 domain-containing protein [Inquilinus sp. CA228]|uniref:DUF1127 domain-containing protein n=1 Tax=Inquilinus sp. CA228 TaxID=3455609 RepID=UPI003F8D1651